MSRLYMSRYSAVAARYFSASAASSWRRKTSASIAGAAAPATAGTAGTAR